MPFQTVLTQRLNLTHPIIQAPMAGGGDTPALVAAVSNAGGIGSMGGAYSTPEQIAEMSRAVREKTNKAFGVNLFAPMQPPERPENPRPALERLERYYAEMGLPMPPMPEKALPSTAPFEEQFAACLDSGAAVFSFTFGMVPADAIQAAKSRGMVVMGTATTVDEAVALERSGVDAVVVQGSEAGGHRGTFGGDFETAMVGTIALVPQVVDAVKVPVVASGGIMDGRGIAAALALGASAVQLGTAFLTCEEAGTNPAYRSKLLSACEHETRITRAFSGRPARGIVNRFMNEIEVPGMPPEAILPFPIQNTLTRPLRTAAAKAGNPEFLSLWAGQGIRMARRLSAAELVEKLVAETEAAVSRLAALR
jgi:nitronate monooxygenase